ncbi:cytochrome p450 [Hirsutella rhossiliensis]
MEATAVPNPVAAASLLGRHLYAVSPVTLALATVAVLWLWLHRRRRPASSQLLPAWVPLEIGITSALLKSNSLASYLLFVLRRRQGSLFGLTPRHQILYNLPSIERLLAKGHHTINTHPLGLSMLLRVFGAPVLSSLRQQFALINAPLTAAVERGFVNDAAATQAIQRGDVARKLARLLSFSADREHQHRWEWTANVAILVPDRPDHPGAVELDLEALLRDLGACISIPLLYGQDFLDRNPGLLDDFWKFDNDAFPLLVAGAPTWLPIRSFREGLQARARLHEALGAFYRRLQQFERNEPVDFGADMSDVSFVARQRNDVFERFGVSTPVRGMLELGTLWGQNANTQPLIFWFVLYVYSTPGLVEALRAEVEPCLVFSTTPNATNQQPSPHAYQLDYAALGRSCPLLKSALLETFRLANEPTSIRYVSRPVTVPDGEHSHHLHPGTWISAPHAGLQRDGSVFPDPDRFVPDRFLELDEQTGRKVPRYGKLKPWGAGVGICKGRTFAEKEILGVVACFITLWDMEPTGGGAWTLPGFVPGTGVMRPKEAVRVVIRRRLFF